MKVVRALLFGMMLLSSAGIYCQHNDEEESMEGPPIEEPKRYESSSRRSKGYSRNTSRSQPRQNDSQNNNNNNNRRNSNSQNRQSPSAAGQGMNENGGNCNKGDSKQQQKIQEKIQALNQNQNQNQNQDQNQNNNQNKNLLDKINQYQNQSQGQNQAAQKAMQKLQKEMQSGGLMKSISPEMIKKVFAQYKGRSDKDIEDAIMQKYQGQPVGTFFKEFPKVRKFLAKCFKDENAIPNLAKILQNKKKLLYFLLFNIGTIIFGWLLKRSFRRDQKSSMIRDIKLFFFRMGLVYSARIAILVSFFGKELKPLWNIFMEVLKS